MVMTNRQPISTDDVLDLFVRPVERLSVAFTTSTTIRLVPGAFSARLPIVTQDPVAGWYAESQEINPTDAVLDELEVIPRAVKALSVISNELANDSSPEAAAVIGDGMARDTATRLDQAWVGALPAPAASGLGAVTGIQTAVGPFTNLDPFAVAISKAQNVGAVVDTFLCGPDVALTLAQLKAGSGSNSPLLGGDATAAGQARILGVNLAVSPAVAASTVWAYDSSRVFSILRSDFTLEVDGSPFFTRDSTTVRSVLRVGFGFPHPASIVKVTPA